MKNTVLALLVAGSLSVAATTMAAAPASGKQPVRQARVAGGEVVTLVQPKLSAGQLSALRPGYRSLRPKVRGNAE